MSAQCPNYEDLKALASELNRPVGTLIALNCANDPFYSGMPSNRQLAEWFGEMWRQYSEGKARHIRRVHYILQAQEAGGVFLPSQTPYVNTEQCWDVLAQASKHARHLKLIDPEELIDRRNPEPLIHWQSADSEAEASIWAGRGGTIELSMPSFPAFLWMPEFHLDEPSRRRPVMVETWGNLDDVIVLTKDLPAKVTEVVLQAWEASADRPPPRAVPISGQATWGRTRDAPDDPEGAP